jgi:hypothetical protein
MSRLIEPTGARRAASCMLRIQSRSRVTDPGCYSLGPLDQICLKRGFKLKKERKTTAEETAIGQASPAAMLLTLRIGSNRLRAAQIAAGAGPWIDLGMCTGMRSDLRDLKPVTAYVGEPINAIGPLTCRC